MARFIGWLVPALSLLLPAFVTTAACEGGDEPPVVARRPVVARFETSGESLPPFLSVPFPSNAYVDNATGHFVKIPVLESTFKRGSDLLNGQLQKLNGWSRIAPVMFLIDDSSAPPRDTETNEKGSAIIDRASLPADEKACMSDASSVFLLDLDASVRVPCRAFFHDESEVDGGRSLVAVGPARGVVLKEGGHYLAVLTSRVKDKNGRTVFASKDFEATAIRKEGPLGALYGAAYDKALSLIGGGLGTTNDSIVSLAPYTTQAITSELYALRDALEAAPAPVLKWDAESLAPMGASKFASTAGGTIPLPAGFTASLDDWLGVLPQPAKLPDGSDDPDEELEVRAHDKIAAIGTAAFEASNWLQVKSTKYDDVDHGTFAREFGSGKPIPAREKPTNRIWITIATPTAPMPATGYPVVIIQHGLSSSRQYMMATANRFCSRGWMAVAIDSVTFGPRAPDPKYAVDTGTDYAGKPGVKYTGPDGISDAIVIGNASPARAGSFEFFGGLKNIGALRDQLRQAEIDTAQVVKLLRSSPDLAPLAIGSGSAPLVTPKIDPDKIAYVGDSLGGIEGTVAAAIEPHVKAWVLNVAGGGILTEIGAHGPAINAQLSLAGALNFGFVGGQYNEGHPVVVIGQALAEGGDPIAYADKLVKNPMPLAGAPTKARNILQIEVLYDELVANEGNEALARAAGFGMAMPNAGANAALSNLSARSAFRGGGIDLTMLPLDPGGVGFHDTPQPGVTALLAQVAPGSHGADLVRSKGGRSYKIPFNGPDGRLALDRIEEKRVPCPYRELQETMLRFFSDAFEGKVPVVTGLPAPVRDLDGDGVPDDVDRDPVDLGDQMTREVVVSMKGEPHPLAPSPPHLEIRERINGFRGAPEGPQC